MLMYSGVEFELQSAEEIPVDQCLGYGDQAIEDTDKQFKVEHNNVQL